MLAKIVCSLVLPPILWLICGAPALDLTGNAILMLVVVLHLYAVIWVREIFVMFQGDAFTYGVAALGINGCAFLTTFITGFVTFLFHGRRIDSIDAVSPYAWGLICLGFFVTILVPLFTTRFVSRLPSADEQKILEDPEGTGKGR